jgi:hypothetical protein
MNLRRPVALAVLCLGAAANASATTYTVTSTADSGAGTLRQAILDANANPGADTIAFGIVGSGVHTIAPASPLPTITDPVTIDGYTQSGSSANTNPASQGLNTVLQIEIDGTNAGAAPCLFVAADDVTIRGLVVNRCTDKAVATTGAHTDFVLEGCFIGTNADGTAALAPYGGGVNPRSQTNARIGGTTPAARNLVSGTSMFADHIAFGAGISEPVSNSLVAGNLVGTDLTGLHYIVPDGPLAMGTGGGSNNVVGGTTAAARNVFAGPILVNGTGNQIVGNFVGLDVTGTIVIAVTSVGITVNSGSNNNTIGGSAAGAGNRVGGAIDTGIGIDGDNNVVRGNQVGTDGTGTVRLSNGYWGIRVGASNNTIGGVGPGEGNIIAYNRGFAGVVVNGVNASVRGNSIFDNAGIQADSGLAIDLTGGNLFELGVNINDALDADAGPNGYQNYPLISSVTYGGANTTIAGTLHSNPSTTFDVDFYSNPACNGRPQEQDEAKTYIGSIEVTTDGSGNATFNEVLAAVVANGSPITATATSPSGATSELSPRFVLSLDPVSGSPTGVIGAQIRGLAFEPGATVTVGGVPATGVTVDNSTTITANIPALPAGSINALTVANPGGGASGTLPNAWISNFNDIPGSQFYTQITSLVANGITAGVGGGNYGINQPTLRQQMAVFLLKAKYGICFTPPPCTGVFDDVPCGSGFAPWIEQLAEEGITGGCGGANYCPGNPVRRDQMAVFILKALHGASYVPPPCEGDFLDVSCASPFSPWIEQLAAEGVTGGCGGGNYCPLNNVTRGQMAAFLYNAFDLP